MLQLGKLLPQLPSIGCAEPELLCSIFSLLCLSHEALADALRNDQLLLCLRAGHSTLRWRVLPRYAVGMWKNGYDVVSNSPVCARQCVFASGR